MRAWSNIDKVNCVLKVYITVTGQGLGLSCSNHCPYSCPHKVALFSLWSVLPAVTVEEEERCFTIYRQGVLEAPGGESQFPVFFQLLTNLLYVGFF